MSQNSNNTLLIDAGNSRLKWAMYHDGRITPGEPLAYQASLEPSSQTSLLLTQFSNAWKGLLDSENTPDRIVLSNVAGTWVVDALHQWVNNSMVPGSSVKDADSLVIDNVLAQENAFGVKNAYQKPEKLGADRWAGLIAAHHRIEGDCCIIGCGSALTIDIIDAAGEHKGGTISPGWQMMKYSLIQGTDAIHDESIRGEHVVPELLGNNTREAVEAGIAAACTGSVIQVIDRYRKLTGKDLHCVITGGWAPLFLTQMQQVNPESNFQYQPDWVLNGLAIISDNSVNNDNTFKSGNMK